jgi:hypothetical protein
MRIWKLCYKIWRDEDPSALEGTPPKMMNVSAKVMWYFPIISHLKHLFTNKANAKLMTWHKEDLELDYMLRHLANGSQWRKIDRTFEKFVEDLRNIRFLSIAGFNPFGEFSNGHSTWL